MDYKIELQVFDLLTELHFDKKSFCESILGFSSSDLSQEQQNMLDFEWERLQSSTSILHYYKACKQSPSGTFQHYIATRLNGHVVSHLVAELQSKDVPVYCEPIKPFIQTNSLFS